ncbi:hypothetical protein F1880_008881, partial [Penicillium rolfsii]
SFVDAAGLKFDIDPLFICNHLGTGLIGLVPTAYLARFAISDLAPPLWAVTAPCLQNGPPKTSLDSQRWCDILHGYEDPLEKAMQNSYAFEAYEARCMNRFGLIASIKSASKAESVGRISILAFIFVPLSFITSFFGMNIVEFGSGSVSLWIFIASATVLMFVVLVVWSLSSWIAGLTSDLRENVYGFKLRLGVLRNMVLAYSLTKTIPKLSFFSRHLDRLRNSRIWVCLNFRLSKGSILPRLLAKEVGRIHPFMVDGVRGKINNPQPQVLHRHS